MIRPPPRPVSKVNELTRAVLKKLNLADVESGEASMPAEAGTVSLPPPGIAAQADDQEAGAFTAPVGNGASVPANLAAPLPPGTTADAAIGDWDDLFRAVKARLKLVSRELLATQGLPHSAAASHAEAGVLECVEALDQLHAMLTQERDRRRQLEHEVSDAQTELTRAVGKLAGNEAGEMLARELSLHDSLTLLPNGTFFRGGLDHALAFPEPEHPALAVLYLDLDAFRMINDAHGHATGDELLRVVAARLTRAVRSEDMVSRVGGDEFACLLTGLPSREHLSHLACKLFDAVSAPLKVGAVKLTVRPSIGISISPGDGTTSETLLRNAGAAMYRAKQQGAGYAFFDERSNAWAHDSH